MAQACLIDRYASRLPVTARTPRFTLGEGSTPLVRAPRLERETGVAEVWLKVEGMNPTGSFKDRGMVSAAAYAARAGLPCAVVLPAGHVALGKLTQALVFGARVVAVRGGFDDAFAIARSLAAAGEGTLVNSLNPYRIEGQKTAAFEVCETLGDAPDALFIPVGNAGNITAYWRGFVEAAASGLAHGRPRLFGYQAEGAAPIVRGERVAEPKTVATAIRIGDPASWTAAVEARDASGGAIEAVSDEEILEAYRYLAACEGIFCEPASAASVAGLRQRAKRGALDGLHRVVCVLTGNGLKDPDTARSAAARMTEVDADADAVRRAIRSLA